MSNDLSFSLGSRRRASSFSHGYEFWLTQTYENIEEFRAYKQWRAHERLKNGNLTTKINDSLLTPSFIVDSNNVREGDFSAYIDDLYQG